VLRKLEDADVYIEFLPNASPQGGKRNHLIKDAAYTVIDGPCIPSFPRSGASGISVIDARRIQVGVRGKQGTEGVGGKVIGRR
jgi:hypothetical protein